jgi:hypothetical protein
MERQDEFEQLISDYAETFDSEAGKRVLNDMKRRAHYNVAYFPTAPDGHTDIYEVCREEGKRAVIVGIEVMLNTEPGASRGVVNVRNEEDDES